MVRLPDPVGNILVVYALRQHPVRDTVLDHLYSFRRYSHHRTFYLNLGLRHVPRPLRLVEFDAVVFHTTFLSWRWTPPLFTELRERAHPLKHIEGVRIALPQDEFLYTDTLCDFINDFDVTQVFSVAPESEWPKIYANVDRSRVRISRVLTGYLEPRRIARITSIQVENPLRMIDIGYRAWRAAPWLGRHGLLKTDIADAFSAAAAQAGLTTDISTRDEDTLYGDAWYHLLATSKYTIGVEGGASVLDRDGSIKGGTEAYVAAHPDADFEEIEASCFPDQDGRLELFAISPRHLEACAARTCQILVEGTYNGVLRPGEHYIELRRDLSNLEEVIELVERDKLREAITDQAWSDVVASGRYTYARLVEQIEPVAVPRRSGAKAPRILVAYFRTGDRISWLILPLRVVIAPRIWRRAVAVAGAWLPHSVKYRLRRAIGTR